MIVDARYDPLIIRSIRRANAINYCVYGSGMYTLTTGGCDVCAFSYYFECIVKDFIKIKDAKFLLAEFI